MSQYSMKVDVYGMDKNYTITKWGSDGYEGGKVADMSSALLEVHVTKQLNMPVLDATMHILPVRDAKGETWADRLNVTDKVVVSVRVSKPTGVKEYVLYMGWITSIGEEQNYRTDGVDESITLSCRSFNKFLGSSFLDFHKMTDAFAGALGVDTSLLEALLNGREGRPDTVIHSIINTVFKGYISNISIKAEKGEIKLGDMLTSLCYTAEETMPYAFSIPHAYQGLGKSFWDVLTSIAEMQSNAGWLHELYIDILPKSKIDNIKNIMKLATGENAGLLQVSDGTKSIPSSKADEDYYPVIVLRPNPFPYLKTDNVEADWSELVKPDANSTRFTLQANGWDAMVNPRNGMFHIVDSAILGSSLSRDNANVKTVFSLDMAINKMGVFSSQIPSVVDWKFYNSKGYDPLAILTNYIQVDNTVKGDKDAPDVMGNLYALNLRFASYNMLRDVFRHGTIDIPLNLDISIGETIHLKTTQNVNGLMGYVTGVMHSLTVDGISKTSLTVDRMLAVKSQSDYKDKIKSKLYERVATAPTVGLKSLVAKAKGLPSFTLNELSSEAQENK